MHVSVLKDEVLENLNLREDSVIVDATLGYGGHSSSILKRITKGHLFAFDQDSEAIEYSTEFLKPFGTRFTIIPRNFVFMKEELLKHGVEQVDGILFDLGVSSPQLDTSLRGFSYHKDAILDMRMDTSNPVDARYIVNHYSEEELANIFFRYGESKYSRSIAHRIVQYRSSKEIVTTLELANLIKESVPERVRRKKHPARAIFQAIRIEVNHELEVLEKALVSACQLVRVGGRVEVITFHSLEDRIVKQFFKKMTKMDPLVQGLPDVPSSYLPDFQLVTRRAIVPSEEEILRNKRSRSAKLRIIERIK